MLLRGALPPHVLPHFEGAFNVGIRIIPYQT